ncbi:mixed-lineage leukemia protein, mll, putative [Perkinsus marinus ATCC 50983]|uniref:Mixed-lineage leukemia protein, mll, putative n=1 Tax=Perkinsus marinus (strain ATCC 50983 / TXsc) TaxID=423536 RepID=C5KD80_PERM5|nr:mixed-lineage leukemia protein, mll, putative [Perkinsus marinus ATCC 50983]EER17513.1 mixed-lineage leukemia protein, mll, putative [Perkinsus marinus ATCC 50983]|eukprot:XP_002785717.1 mixed-lineage leukemia protein, mll, putative [Perkinsus marinus ATCC 50983]
MKDSDGDYLPMGGSDSTRIGEQIKTEPEEQADSKDEESVQPLQCCICKEWPQQCLNYCQRVAMTCTPFPIVALTVGTRYCCEPLGTYPTNWDKLSLVKLFGCLEVGEGSESVYALTYQLAVVCHGCILGLNQRGCPSQGPASPCIRMLLTVDSLTCIKDLCDRYCPVCLRAWSTVWCDDMVQCDGCEFWVHAKCDNFTCKEQFTELTDKDVKYFCPICRDSTSKSKYIRALDLLKALDKSHLFSEPVNAAFAPLYLRVVKKPMNLRKMRQKAEAHMYPSVQDFVDDFDQIIANAKLFNMPNTQTYKIAEQFEKNGKLVLERYLLKVAGAAGVAKIVNESPSSPALPIDVASIEGSDKSARTRRSTRISTKPGTDGPSPYKQRLKKSRKAPSSSTRLLLSPSISPASLIITDPRILDLIALVPLCNRLILVVSVRPPVPPGIPLWSPRGAQFHSSLYRIPYLFTVVGSSLNAVLSRVAGLPDKKSYHCPGCNRCPYCAQICSKSLSNDPTELAAPKMMCVKCGIIWHSKCRDRWIKKTASSDKLGDWLWDDKFIMCDQCAAEQYKVSFNASHRCLACNGTIIDGTASKKTCSSKILCLICGGRWHSKCIPEFRDLTMISIPDYICAQCLADTPMDELPRRRTSNDQTPTTTASDTEIAKSLSSELISIRNRHAACAERSRMLDALAGRHNSGLLRKLPKHLEPALQQTMALAGATSGGNAGTTPSVIGEDCEDWLVRTMGQDVFMPRRATKVSGKTSPTVSTPQDALIAQRLLAARDILQWIDTQDSSTDHTGHDSSPSPVRAETVLVQRSWWLQQGSDPAVLLLKIIHKMLTSVDKGYIGAFLLLTESSAVPSHWNGGIESQCAHTRLGLLPTDFSASPLEHPRREPDPGATSAHALPQYARLSRFRIDDGVPVSANSAVRSGGLSVIRMGTIDSKHQLEQPNGFIVIRLFWSVEPTRRRSAYVCTIDYDDDDDRVVTIRVATGGVIAVADSIEDAWRQLVEQFSTERRQQVLRDFTPQWFFGLMSPVVVAHLREVRKAFARRKIMQEASLWMDHPGARAQLLTGLLGPGNDSCGPVESLKLKSSWEQPVQPDMRELGVVRVQERGISPLLIGQRSAHYKFLLDPSNCPVESSTGSNSQTTGEYNQMIKSARTRMHWPEGSSSSPTLTALYRIRAQTDDNEVLEVKRSRIHNYGLFAKVRFAKGDMVVEYAGEIVRHSVADCRERYYEEEMLMGQCCYMFRLDEHYVVDATLRGNTARFINHSCNPNCVCKVVEDPVPLASEDDISFRGVVRASHKKHIMIVAKNDISAGEEITYDYQFAVESEKLACKCGAPNCLGRLN